MVRELSERGDLVIDCGGGVIVRDENIRSLRENGRVVWLKATVQTISDRIADDTQRPSLTGSRSFLDEIEEVLRERLPLYKKASDFSLDTDSAGIVEITDRIVEWWEKAEG